MKASFPTMFFGRSISNVVECALDQVKIGMPVKVVYEDNEELTLPKFRPA